MSNPTAPKHDADSTSELDVATMRPPPDDGEFDEYADDPLLGTTLAETYKLLRVLGEGGMGRVYEAKHVRLHAKRFAIKVLHPEYVRESVVIERFSREAEATAMLDNPHVVDVYDVDRTDDGRPFLVSEFLDGKELGEYLTEVEQLSIASTVRVVRHICRALAAAHEQGIIHRDIKPENVFLTGPIEHPTVKVLDFGLSRLTGKQGNSLTKTGHVMGTPSYMAPEQARGLPVDHRADIYATGSILYRALTGKPPFDRNAPQTTIVAVLTEEPPRPRSLNPDIPEHLELIIQRAMAKEPDERFQTIAELDNALASYDIDAFDSAPITSRHSEVVMSNFEDPDSLFESGQPSGPIALERQTRIVRDARPMMAVLATLATLGAFFLGASAITATIRIIRGGVRGAPLSPTEAILVLAVTASILLTPTLLVLWRLGKGAWLNTARLLELIRLTRNTLLTGAGVYGFSALSLRMVETMFIAGGRDVNTPLWDLLLAGVSIFAVISVLFRHWQRTHGKTKGWPIPSSVQLIIGSVFVLSAISVILALRPSPEANQTTTSEPQSSANQATTNAALAPLRKQRAHQLWAEFQRQALGKRTKEALTALEQLLRADPSAHADKQVRNTLVRLATTSLTPRSPHAGTLVNILSTQMGPTGPDVLYEIYTTRGGTAAAKYAEHLLGDDELRARGSDALRIAWTIRQARNCDAVLGALPQAEKAGDQRTITELQLVATCRAVSGCCLRRNQQITRTIRTLSKRQ